MEAVPLSGSNGSVQHIHSSSSDREDLSPDDELDGVFLQADVYARNEASSMIGQQKSVQPHTTAAIKDALDSASLEPVTHDHHSDYDQSGDTLWNTVYKQYSIDLEKSINAQQVATFAYKENIISKVDFHNVQAMKRESSQTQASELLALLSNGINLTFDTLLSILHNKIGTEQQQILARRMNDYANDLLPARQLVFSLDGSRKGRFGKVKTLEDIKPEDKSPKMVIYRHAAQLCEVELEILLDRYRFDSEEGNTTAARIIMESGYSKTEKRVLLVELLMTESSVEDLVQLLKRRKRGDLAKKIIADYDSFRRANLPDWTVIPLFYSNQPKMEVKTATNGLPYLKETPAIEYYTKSRVTLEDYITDSGGGLPAVQDEGNVEAKGGLHGAATGQAKGEFSQFTDRHATKSNLSKHSSGNACRRTSSGSYSTSPGHSLTTTTGKANKRQESLSDSFDRTPDYSGTDDQSSSVLDVDLTHLFKQTHWHRKHSVKLETVALIGDSDSTRIYCQKFLPDLSKEQCDKIWRSTCTESDGGSAGSMTFGRSSVHVILRKPTTRSPTRQYIFVVRLGPSDSKSNRLRLLHRVLLGCQSLHVLYWPTEVNTDWLIQPSQNFGSMTMVISNGERLKVLGESGECDIQKSIVKAIRTVFDIYPMIPLYRCVREPAYNLRFSVLHNCCPLEKPTTRLEPICAMFRIQRSTATKDHDYKLAADKTTLEQQQLPTVSVKSNDSANIHPQEVCCPVQNPLELWLDDMTVESPITLLAATDFPIPTLRQPDGLNIRNKAQSRGTAARVVCSPFPSFNSQIPEQIDEDVSNCFWRIQDINQLNCLASWDCNVSVIACISETPYEAFNCLNYITGGSFPVSESTLRKATGGMDNDYPVSRLMACTRYAEGRLYVMLAVPDITAEKLRSGIETGQENLLLAAIALSHVFILDSPVNLDQTITGFTKTLQMLKEHLPTNGKVLDRRFIDDSLFCGHLVVMSQQNVGDELFPDPVKDVMETIFPWRISGIKYETVSSLSEAVPRSEKKGAAPRTPYPSGIKNGTARVTEAVGSNKKKEAQLSASTRSGIPSPDDCCKYRIKQGDPARSEPRGYAQARAAFYVMKDVFMPTFTDGSSFITALNLVLALACKGFSNSTTVADLYGFETRMLEKELKQKLRHGMSRRPSIIRHRHRHAMREFSVTDPVFGEDGQVEALTREIREGLLSSFDRDSNIGTVFHITTAVQKCIETVVEGRCGDAERYLDSQLETGDYRHVNRSDLLKVIEVFRGSWSLCGIHNRTKTCHKCFFRCLLIAGHESPCDCLSPDDDKGAHTCGQPCGQEAFDSKADKWYECQQRCTEKAAHAEGDISLHGTEHKCELIKDLDKHRCRENCHLSASPSCKILCNLFVKHSKDEKHCCALSKDDHKCDQPCELLRNPIWPSSGVLERPATDNHGCHVLFTSDRSPSLKQLCCQPLIPKAHKHLCGLDHKCIEPCGITEGICAIYREGHDVQPNGTLESGQDGYRLLCHERIKSNVITHGPTHTCGEVHRCSTRCPLCNCHCTKDAGHETRDGDAQHSIEQHGVAVRSTELLILTGENRQPACGSSLLTCHEVCVQASRGHIHQLSREGLEGSEQTSSRINVTHDEFWAHFNFKQPSSDTDFSRCSAICHDKSHDESESPTYCSESVLHDLLLERTVSSGYVSLERDEEKSRTLHGHHFPCSVDDPSSHQCHGVCIHTSLGQKCEQRCNKALSHKGEDCHCGDRHVCGKKCIVTKLSRGKKYECNEDCEKSSEENHVCHCTTTDCIAPCDIQGCEQPCKLEHDHQGENHDCKGDHVCIEICETYGRCGSAGNETPNVIVTKNKSKGKQICAKVLPNPERDHCGPHQCQSVEHFCLDRCKACEQPCNLRPRHDGVAHNTSHGKIIHEKNMRVYKANISLVTTDGLSCSGICRRAGRGHVHVLSTCGHPNGKCTTETEMVRHIPKPGRPHQHDAVHVTSHSVFWQRVGYEDTYSDPTFERCHALYGGPKKHNNPVYCSGKMWHESYSKISAGSLSKEITPWSYPPKVIYHLFEGMRRNCRSKCACDDFGKSCSRGCCEEADHTCSKHCDPACRGLDDPDHNHNTTRDVYHHCGEPHHCGKMCQETAGICFRLEEGGDQPPSHSEPLANGKAYKLPCAEIIPYGKDNHTHLQSKHWCGRTHTCEKFCPLCGQYCKLTPNHEAPCETEHGRVLTSEMNKIWTVDQKEVSLADRQGVTCAELCLTAGPSHSHEVKCRCSGVGWTTIRNFYRHRSNRLSWTDDVNHEHFWKETIGFKDPTSNDDQKAVFSRCTEQCDDKEHKGNDSEKFHCDAGLFHSELNPDDYKGKPGYLRSKKPRHHFSCDTHMCSNDCAKNDNGKPCSEKCKLGANHVVDGKDCVCKKQKHTCAETCAGIRCTGLCQEEWSKTFHVHMCASSGNCAGQCDFENCERRCSLRHIHTGTKCDCCEDHTCPNACEKPELCATEVVKGTGLKRAVRSGCKVKVLAGRTSHDGAHSCGKQHTCSKQCALCKSFCTVSIQQSNHVHNTKHGRIVDPDKWPILKIDGDRLLNSEDLTCDNLCSKAAAGHSHVLRHPSSAPRCDTQKCRPLEGNTSHHATHRHFWEQLEFADPTEAALQEEFHRCGVPCDRHPGDSSADVLCTGEQWHDAFHATTSQHSPDYGYIGNIKDTPCFGHRFKCKGHSCDMPCQLSHFDSKADRSDRKCGLPLGNGYIDASEVSRGGVHTASPREDQSKHVCKEQHVCQGECKADETGHCSRVTIAGQTNLVVVVVEILFRIADQTGRFAQYYDGDIIREVNSKEMKCLAHVVYHQ